MSKANAEADREQEEEEAACAEPQQLGGGREAEEVQGRAVEACLGILFICQQI